MPSHGPGAGSGNSKAGSAGVMQDGDQRNVSKRDIESHDRHHLGNIKAFINADQSISTPLGPNLDTLLTNLQRRN
jgi:hypothetical protein